MFRFLVLLTCCVVLCVGYKEAGVCSDNEIYSSCTQAECRALNCTEKDQPVLCVRMDPRFCEKGCVCKAGYLRNDDGICVLEDKCELCPDNERYSTCIQAECRALNCTQKNKPVLCARMDPRFCKKSCVCKAGHLRNDDGICVLEDKCEPGVCPDNERYSTCTQAECRALNCTQKNKPVLCVLMDARFCKKGCVCKAGYLRNDDGICVLEDKCEQPGCTGENEVYTDCKESCPPELCFSIVAFYDCSTAEPCTKGCACKPGYLRKEMDSPCIPTCKCPELEDTSECSEAAAAAKGT